MDFENFFEKFTHEHPFILQEEHNHDENSVPPRCNVCGKEISSDPFYRCEEYCDEDISIHKSCTELPLQIQHSMHQDHPLFLVSDFFLGGYSCDACKSDFKNSFVYHCYICNFGLDLSCASILTKESVEHLSHKHPLKISSRTHLCFCDACGKNHQGLFYSCSICDEFWIHQDCASLPTTFLNTHYHDHSLTLAYSLPDQYTSFGQLCQICEKMMPTVYWVYHCANCRFLVHVDCVTPQTEHFLSVLLPQKEFYSSRRKGEITTFSFYTGVVQLPLPDDSLSLTGHLLRSIQRRATNYTTQPDYVLSMANLIIRKAESVRAGRENKICHSQPLILSSDDVQGSDTRLDILHDHEKYQKKLCNACVRPVTTPFYKCVEECNTILHESCIELPLEIQHPFHSEHVLTLQTTDDFNCFLCRGCNIPCSGYSYACDECNYLLDVICASLPTTIKYKPHANHAMTLKEKISRHCNACYNERGDSTFAFGCQVCDFELHAICATYPSKFRHRYDNLHPYTLTYRPVEDHETDYLCDICELQLNPMWWFYHCVECDQSMHTYCHPTYDYRARMKFGGIITIKSHEHPLISVPVIPIDTQCNGYVRVITEGTICSICGDAFDVQGLYYPMGFKCSECRYNIHHPCLAKVAEDDGGIDVVRPS